MRTNIAAFTPVGDYPPYISVNLETDGTVTVTVRGEKPAEGQSPEALIRLTREQWSKFLGEAFTGSRQINPNAAAQKAAARFDVV